MGQEGYIVEYGMGQEDEDDDVENGMGQEEYDVEYRMG